MLNAEMCAVLCYIGFFIENKVHVAGRELQGRKGESQPQIQKKFFLVQLGIEPRASGLNTSVYTEHSSPYFQEQECSVTRGIRIKVANF